MNHAVSMVRVANAMGVHARPAAAIVNTANQFDADIQLQKDGVAVNAKSIMGVLMLAAEQGSTLEISATGTDADHAVGTLVALVKSGFPGLDQG